MRCQLSRLQKGHATDEWFQLSSHVPLKGIEPGSLRVRARYSMEKIMPEEEYSEFKELILQKEMHVVYALSHVCGQDRTLLAGILLKIFLHEKLESLLLRTLNDREISMEDEATTLFRATTLASTLMEQYMKATATSFVHHALKDSILKIMESKQSFKSLKELGNEYSNQEERHPSSACTEERDNEFYWTVWIRWPGTSDSWEYKALVDMGAQCTLMPLESKGMEPIWVKMKENAGAGDVTVGVCYRPSDQDDKAEETLYKQIGAALHSQTLLLMGNFNHPDIC
ncbi:ras gtpase-activating protein hypothetical protein [Limosa lapponica baueri]|uniref:Ras-GAP domain-containing protein n=1 Tax=Limosa lapponica baueri TaxID=1758121 RepID=A0A2I0TLB5_LIMLA|nr:ras gtpase-activating protein hypothetical protein [Limosa lapponica baueri]